MQSNDLAVLQAKRQRLHQELDEVAVAIHNATRFVQAPSPNIVHSMDTRVSAAAYAAAHAAYYAAGDLQKMDYTVSRDQSEDRKLDKYMVVPVSHAAGRPIGNSYAVFERSTIKRASIWFNALSAAERALQGRENDDTYWHSGPVYQGGGVQPWQ